MSLLSIVFFLILIMVAYSCGAAIIVGRTRVTAPGLVDLGGLFALWILGFLTYSALGKGQAMLVWLPAAALAASCITLIRLGSFPARAMSSEGKLAGIWWRSIWEGWKLFAARMGNYQGRMLLAVFYFVVISPWGFVVRLFSDPLHLRDSSAVSHWAQREVLQADMEEAGRQF